MSTTPLQRRNRKRILAFLRKLPRRKFDLSSLIAGVYPKGPPEPSCGTVACAMGWTPVVFPRQVSWKRYGIEHIDGAMGFDAITHKLYGVDTSDAFYLFNAIENYDLELDADKDPVPRLRCSGEASPKRFARRLEAYFKAHP